MKIKLKSYLALALLIFTLFYVSSIESTAKQTEPKVPSIQDSYIVDGTNWTVGCFSCHDQTLNFIGMSGFDYSLTNDSLHFLEDGGVWPNPYGSPTYTSMGTYTTFPTVEGHLVLNFTARATANHIDAVLMGIRIYDPSSMTWLMSSASHPEDIPSIISPGMDSGWLDMTLDVTVPECDELAVFWSFNDFFSNDWKQEFWVENINVVTEEPIEEPDDFTLPIIENLNITIFEENYSVNVSWNVYDENPGYYQIYLNDVLKINESWLDTEIISVVFENLTSESYNITLKVYDIYSNFAVSSVIFEAQLNTTLTSFPILFALVGIISIITLRRKKKKQ